MCRHTLCINVQHCPTIWEAHARDLEGLELLGVPIPGVAAEAVALMVKEGIDQGNVPANFLVVAKGTPQTNPRFV